MAKDYPRGLRIAQQIHRTLAHLLREALADPRLHEVTILDVEVSPDLAQAKVYFTVLDAAPDDAQRVRESQQALDHAAGFLRRELARRLPFKSTPRLRFSFDETEYKAARLDALIRAARATDADQP